jgi:hypothetical protein
VRGFLGLCAIAACAVALAACGGAAHTSATTPSPTPSAVGPSSTSGSASSNPSAPPTQTGPLLTGHGVTPGEVPPTRSSFSLPHTADGALAFAFYFYKALDWSIATTDPYLLRQISATTCVSCYKYINSMSSIERAGGYSSGARGTVTAAELVKGDGRIQAEYTVRVTLTQTTQVVVTSSGAAAVTYSHDATPVTNFLYLRWGASGWQAAEIGTP